MLYVLNALVWRAERMASGTDDCDRASEMMHDRAQPLNRKVMDVAPGVHLLALLSERYRTFCRFEKHPPLREKEVVGEWV